MKYFYYVFGVLSVTIGIMMMAFWTYILLTDPPEEFSSNPLLLNLFSVIWGYVFFFIFLFCGLYWLKKAKTGTSNKQQEIKLHEIDLERVGHLLKVKTNLTGRLSNYFEDGQYVASFDGGPCNLEFCNGKMYSYSEWTPDWVKNLVFAKGSAKIALIADYHYEVVDDEASASMTFYADNGEVTYYKEGEIEIVAHSEITLDGNAEVIVCNKKEYRVIRTKKFTGWVAELYENSHSIASIKTRLFRTKSIFKSELALLDRVFITLLVNHNW